MNIFVKIKLLVLVVVVLQVLFYQLVFVQVQSLEEVVVIVCKWIEILMDVLVVVIVVFGQVMEFQGIFNMEQFFGKVFGLQIGCGVQIINICICGVGFGINKGFE